MSDVTSALEQTLAAYRVALLQRDAVALRQLMAAYAATYARMQARVATLTAQIVAARARGEVVTPSWLYEQQRLATLQRQLVGEWDRYAGEAQQIITDLQQTALATARREATQLTLAALADAGLVVTTELAQVPLGAFADLVGVLGDGSPLRSLLDALGTHAAQEVGNALLHAVAVGQNPRQTARQIRDALGGDLNRALRIARTEHMRAYRSASLRTYQANSDILRGWMWRASPSRRTCPVCLALDGSEHPLEEPFAGHVSCRCTPVPLLHNQPAPPHETGADWFARQDEATQRAMLGPGKFDLYRTGQITLHDLVGTKDDARWGRSVYERSINELETLGVAEGKKRGQRTGANRDAEYSIPAKPFITPSQRSLAFVRTEEDRIRSQTFESGYAINRTGTVLLQKPGGKTSVDITINERATLRGHTGVVFTHNHPIGWSYKPNDPRHQGVSFSLDDVELACLTQLSEMRVVTPTRRFWMRPAKEGWNGDYYYDILLPEVKNLEKVLRREEKSLIARGELTQAKADAQHLHILWTRVAEKLGLGYGEEAE